MILLDWDNVHLLYTCLETISRFRFAVVNKLVLCYKQPLIVAKCLVGIESHKACWHRQGVLADQEVLVVMDENVVLEGAAEMQVQLVVSSTGIPLKAKSVAPTKLHGGKVSGP